MRAIVHLAVDADRARTRLSCERRDDGLCLFDLRRSRREYVVDNRHLSRVNGEAPCEAIAPRGGNTSPMLLSHVARYLRNDDAEASAPTARAGVTMLVISTFRAFGGSVLAAPC